MTLLLLACTLLAAFDPALQAGPAPPLGAGRRLVAADGDVIVVDNADRVRVIRRRQADVRTIYDAAQGWVVLLLDYAGSAGEKPDGRVDMTQTFRTLSGPWPLGDRWEGPALVEDYTVAGEGGPRGLGLTTADGLIQLLSPMQQEFFRDPSAMVALVYSGSGASSARAATFDLAEVRAVAEARNDAQRGRSPAGSSTGGSMGGATYGVTLEAGTPSPSAPVRVGGNIAAPAKVFDVAPAYPEAARTAGVTGSVIIEATIDETGRVARARILRSVPLLDDAALEAVRQWRYEPVQLNGRPVAVIMTVAVRIPHP